MTVKGKTVSFEDGSTTQLVGTPFKTDDGGLTYSIDGAPLGTYYPAGVKLSLPKTFRDQPDQDRIWNSQTQNLYVRADSGSTSTAPSSNTATATVKGFPAPLQGRWCSTDGKTCFSLSTFRSENPTSFLFSADPSTSVPGATDYSLCYAPDMGKGQCTTAASMFLRYLPAGTKWNCKMMGAAQFSLDSCRPDYSKAHDTSRARLMIVPNHQQGAQYVDTPPMYRADG